MKPYTKIIVIILLIMFLIALFSLIVKEINILPGPGDYIDYDFKVAMLKGGI